MYEELVNNLRYEANYAYLGEEEARLKKLIRQAADAIEELSRINRAMGAEPPKEENK